MPGHDVSFSAGRIDQLACILQSATVSREGLLFSADWPRSETNLCRQFLDDVGGCRVLGDARDVVSRWVEASSGADHLQALYADLRYWPESRSLRKSVRTALRAARSRGHRASGVDVIRVATTDVRVVSRALEFVVVSLHRVPHDYDDPAFLQDPLHRYLAQGAGWCTLSRARQIVELAVDRCLDEEAVDAIYEGLESWPPHLWSASAECSP